jgi:photosystem II stability/assembly factor-like uncharacterized protein
VNVNMKYTPLFFSIFMLLAPAISYADWTVKTPSALNLNGFWGNGQNLYAVGAKGTILHSVDNGESWQTETSGTTEALNNIWGSGLDNMYVVGANGTLLYSSDQGKTWIPRKLTGAPALRSIWGASRSGGSPQDIYAIGEGGLILHSQDGTAWTQQNSGVSQELFGIWGASAQDVYIVGDQGLILHSTNSGQSWVTLTSNTTSLLHGIWGSSPDDIYVVGYQSPILHSSDQGKTWTQQTRDPPDWLASVWGSGPNDVYAVGAKGTILHSTDKGLSWSQDRDLLLSFSLCAVWGKSPNEVFMVGQSGNLLRLVISPIISLTAKNPESEGAEVWVDGINQGVIPLSLPLPLGEHSLEVKKTGYQTFTAALPLESNQVYPIPVELALQQLMTTIAISRPPSANVFLDGVLRGKVPITLSDVVAGNHKLVVQQKGFQDWSRKFFIAAGTPPMTLMPELSQIIEVDAEKEKAIKNSNRLYFAAGDLAVGSILFSLLSLREALLSANLTQPCCLVGEGVSVTEQTAEAAKHYLRMQVFGAVSVGVGGVAVASGVGGFVIRHKINNPNKAENKTN